MQGNGAIKAPVIHGFFHGFGNCGIIGFCFYPVDALWEFFRLWTKAHNLNARIPAHGLAGAMQIFLKRHFAAMSHQADAEFGTPSPSRFHDLAQGFGHY